MVRVAILLANGFEEIETITPIDILRRAGIEVTIVGVDSKILSGKVGVKVVSELDIKDLKSENYDMLILPGGKQGADTLTNSATVQTIIKEFSVKGKKIGAICAAPMALDKAGLLNSDFTCYPGVKDEISNGNYIDEKVVYSNNIVTSKGPATAIDFSLEIVRLLTDHETYESVKKAILA